MKFFAISPLALSLILMSQSAWANSPSEQNLEVGQTPGQTQTIRCVARLGMISRPNLFVWRYKMTTLTVGQANQELIAQFGSYAVVTLESDPQGNAELRASLLNLSGKALKEDQILLGLRSGNWLEQIHQAEKNQVTESETVSSKTSPFIQLQIKDSQNDRTIDAQCFVIENGPGKPGKPVMTWPSTASEPTATSAK